jgi:hypothetical protein
MVLPVSDLLDTLIESFHWFDRTVGRSAGPGTAGSAGGVELDDHDRVLRIIAAVRP